MFKTANLIDSAILSSYLLSEATKKLETEYIPQEFIVSIDDISNGVKLIDIIENNTSLNIRKYDVSLGDYILFVKDDIRLLDIYKDFNSIFREGRKHLTLKNNYTKVKEIVNNFFRYVFTPKKKNVVTTIINSGGIPGLNNINPFTAFEFATSPIKSTYIPKISGLYYDGDRLNVDEKISIFNNFVKVGYDAYEIFETILGEKVVKIGKSIYSINEDFLGNKYIQKV